MFDGRSPQHAGSVAPFLNLETKHVSPQLNLAFDPRSFGGAQPPSKWQVNCGFTEPTSEHETTSPAPPRTVELPATQLPSEPRARPRRRLNPPVELPMGDPEPGPPEPETKKPRGDSVDLTNTTESKEEEKEDGKTNGDKNGKEEAKLKADGEEEEECYDRHHN